MCIKFCPQEKCGNFANRHQDHKKEEEKVIANVLSDCKWAKPNLHSNEGNVIETFFAKSQKKKKIKLTFLL